jgi:hypothetical protein
MYELEILPTNQKIKRNYDDFYKLKSNLEKVYPGIKMPHLLKSNWFADTKNKDLIKKQK